MSAGTYTMAIEQGSSFSLQLTIEDSLNVPIDLTGHVFRGQIRRTISDPVIQASFTFNILNQITDTGKVVVTLDPADTMAISLPAQRTVTRADVPMSYDIESEIAGTVYRWLEGTANISPEVTR
jgi:hypothetical protein